jgi:hypothetical protein
MNMTTPAPTAESAAEKPTKSLTDYLRESHAAIGWLVEEVQAQEATNATLSARVATLTEALGKARTRFADLAESCSDLGPLAMGVRCGTGRDLIDAALKAGTP